MHAFPVPGACIEHSRWAESAGFDGILLADSQNLVGDPFVELGVLSRATTRLGLGTGVINPVTRHPAVVAAAAATVQRESGGRAVLGVGRGDSALVQLGLPRATTAVLVQFIRDVRRYLHGEIDWIAKGSVPPPPIELAASGPRTIGQAATLADRVMLTVGADPERIAGAIETARRAREDAGLDAHELRVGAYLNVACDDDLATACQLVRGSAAIFAHFSSTFGHSYDESRHGLSSAEQARSLSVSFLQRFAVVGPAGSCASRLTELIDLGLDRVVVVPGSRDSDPELLARTNTAFAELVLPHLRQVD